MLYTHHIEACFDRAIGEYGLTETQYRNSLNTAALAATETRTAFFAGDLPFLKAAHRRDDLAAMGTLATRLCGLAETVLVLGGGGAVRAGRALQALAEPPGGRPRGGVQVLFVPSPDPRTIAGLYEQCDPARSAVVALSSAGRDSAVLAQFVLMRDWLAAALGPAAAAERLVAMTAPGPNPLRDLAEAAGAEVFDDDPGVPGRFGGLTPIGLLPGLIAGLDAKSFRAGAAAVLDQVLAAEDPTTTAPCQGAALNAALLWHRGVSATAVLAYADRLVAFGDWFRQLWAETLGKDGNGTTPLFAEGCAEGHGRRQLYLAGPRDKLFTLIGLDGAASGPELAGGAGAPDWMTRARLGDVIAAEQAACAAVLGRAGRPVRRVEVPDLDETTLGALMMHFMLEAIFCAHLFGVAPFDRAAAEAGAQLTHQYLSGNGQP